jgi:hypothetical protein
MSIETPFGTVLDLKSLLTDLTDDIQYVCEHGHPDPMSLTGAPCLTVWALASKPASSLVGSVAGHPLLGDNPNIYTSPVLAIDANNGWARTWSRFYRLQSPLRGPPRH